MAKDDVTGAASLAAAPPIRVTIVDDSVVVRGLFSRWLAEMADVEIAGIHRNGLEAVRQIANVRPDVVILDIEMPEMDGLTALPLLLEASPGSKVLVVSGMSVRGADITLRCIMRGAVDYLAKPSSIHESTSLDDFRDALMQRVRAVGARRVLPRTLAQPVMPPGAGTERNPAAPVGAVRAAAPRAAGCRPHAAASQRPELIVIGASTGGPPVIADLARALRPVLPHVPVVVAQQMPATFSMLFADLLRRQAGIQTREIVGGEEIMPGVVHICRGGQNMTLARSGGRIVAQRAEGRDAAFGKPSIDLMFESAAQICGARLIGVVLTGIGRDGVAGAEKIVAARGTVLVQDEASSAVWGMPGAVVQAGVASAALPVDALAARICQIAGVPPA